jgi:serine/threonine protein kinase
MSVKKPKNFLNIRFFFSSSHFYFHCIVFGIFLKKIMKFFIEMMLGLNEMHKKRILHRDIKPGNVLLNENKEDVKLGLVFFFVLLLLFISIR